MKALQFILNLFFKQKKENFIVIDNIVYQKTNKTKRQFYIDYMYEFVTELNFPLENIYIHNKSSDGAFVKIGKDNIKYEKHNILLNKGLYLFLPELNEQLNDTDFNTRIDTWFHEIGHYLHKHFESNESLYYQEYEACLYAHNQMKRLPIPVYNLNKTHIRIDGRFSKRLLDIDIKYRAYSSVQYIKSFLDDYVIKHIDIPDIVKPEVKEFFKLENIE